MNQWISTDFEFTRHLSNSICIRGTKHQQFRIGVNWKSSAFVAQFDICNIFQMNNLSKKKKKKTYEFSIFNFHFQNFLLLFFFLKKKRKRKIRTNLHDIIISCRRSTSKEKQLSSITNLHDKNQLLVFFFLKGLDRNQFEFELDFEQRVRVRLWKLVSIHNTCVHKSKLHTQTHTNNL